MAPRVRARRALGTVVACGALLAAACAPAMREATWNLEGMSVEDALARLAERSREVEALAGEGRLTLVDGEGESTVLRVALAARRPDHLRLRAFKLGQAVLDLTVRPDGTWLWIADRAEDARGALLPEQEETPAEGEAAQSFDARRLGPWLWAALWPRFREEVPAPSVMVLPSSYYALHSSAEGLVDVGGFDGLSLEWILDPWTAEVRTLRFFEPSRLRPERVRLERYREDAAGRSWPQRMVITAPAGEIRLELESVDLYADPKELAPRAFEPPSRAGRWPSATAP